MTPPISGYTHVPANYDQSSYLTPDAEMAARQKANRRDTLGSVLRYARDNGIGAAGLVEITELLGLDEELLELAGDPLVEHERHRRLAAAIAELHPSTASSDGS